MSTNIIYITNTLTNIINMPPEVTNTVLRVAEMPSKALWLDFTFWGAVATIVSAVIMACSVQKMGKQIKISQQSVEEMCRQRELQQRQWEEELYQKDTQIMRELLENMRLKYNSLSQDKHTQNQIKSNPNNGRKIAIELAHVSNLWITDALFRLSYRSRYKEKCRKYQAAARNIINNQKILLPKAFLDFVKNIPHVADELERYTESPNNDSH